MADLVKRLRSSSAVGAAQAAHEAAAEIEKLRAEIVKLRVALRDCRDASRRWSGSTPNPLLRIIDEALRADDG